MYHSKFTLSRDVITSELTLVYQNSRVNTKAFIPSHMAYGTQPFIACVKELPPNQLLFIMLSDTAPGDYIYEETPDDVFEILDTFAGGPTQQVTAVISHYSRQISLLIIDYRNSAGKV